MNNEEIDDMTCSFSISFSKKILCNFATKIAIFLFIRPSYRTTNHASTRATYFAYKIESIKHSDYLKISMCSKLDIRFLGNNFINLLLKSISHQLANKKTEIYFKRKQK